MKYAILTLTITITAFATGSAAAQTPQQQAAATGANAAVRESATPQTVWFSAEGSNYFITTGCQPNTPLAWYSQRWGGKLLKTSTTNATGESRLKEGPGFRPAFALNNSSGKVGFLDAAEFALEPVKAITAGGIVTITWKATVAAGIPIVFEVLKAAPGGAYSVAATYRASAAGIAEPFSFTEPQAAAGTQYRVRVRNEAAGERYLSRQLLQDDHAGAVAIYPTVVADALTINVQGGGAARYTITGADGRCVAQGTLGEGVQTIPLSTLAGGAYLVSVLGEGGTTTAKIVKQ